MGTLRSPLRAIPSSSSFYPTSVFISSCSVQPALIPQPQSLKVKPLKLYWGNACYRNQKHRFTQIFSSTADSFIVTVSIVAVIALPLFLGFKVAQSVYFVMMVR
ncbi:unnamed protein product [Victoria cruziana]